MIKNSFLFDEKKKSLFFNLNIYCLNIQQQANQANS